MKKQLFITLLLLTAVFFGCRKDFSLENSGLTPPVTPVPPVTPQPGPNPASTYKWEATIGSDFRAGCTDTAFLTNVSAGQKSLTVRCSDTAGNFFNIVITAANIVAGSYSADSQLMMLYNKGTDVYSNASPGSSAVVNITFINDTLLEASFSATLIAPVGAATAKITNGKLRSLIGKSNGCGNGLNNNPFGGTWSFNRGTASFQGSCTALKIPNPIQPGSLLIIGGPNAQNTKSLSLTLQLSDSVIKPETFFTSPLKPANSFIFSNISNPGIEYQATLAGIAGGALMTMKITSYNAATKTVSGTFSGTALDSSNAKVFITNGKFSSKVL